jgi:hypothetical protein
LLKELTMFMRSLWVTVCAVFSGVRHSTSPRMSAVEMTGMPMGVRNESKQQPLQEDARHAGDVARRLRDLGYFSKDSNVAPTSAPKDAGQVSASSSMTLSYHNF